MLLPHTKIADNTPCPPKLNRCPSNSLFLFRFIFLLSFSFLSCFLRHLLSGNLSAVHNRDFQRLVLWWLEFTVNVNSRAEIAKPQNGGETKRFFTTGIPCAASVGWRVNYRWSKPIREPAFWGRTWLNGYSPVIPQEQFFFSDAFTTQPHTSNFL